MIPVSGYSPSPPFFSDSLLRDHVRARSKALLGNKDSVEVGAAVCLSKDGVVNATDLARTLGVENNRVRAQLLTLVRSGLLREASQGAGKRWFVRRRSPYWETCRQLIEDWCRDFAEEESAAAAVASLEER